MLSYFGTDQSQVQRYLTAKSVDEARSSLLMSAYWKIPLQALILLVGVLVFVFYLFTPAPMLFNPQHERAGAAAASRPPTRRSRRAIRRRSRQRAAAAREASTDIDNGADAATTRCATRLPQRRRIGERACATRPSPPPAG